MSKSNGCERTVDGSSHFDVLARSSSSGYRISSGRLSCLFFNADTSAGNHPRTDRQTVATLRPRDPPSVGPVTIPETRRRKSPVDEPPGSSFTPPTPWNTL